MKEKVLDLDQLDGLLQVNGFTSLRHEAPMNAALQGDAYFRSNDILDPNSGVAIPSGVWLQVAPWQCSGKSVGVAGSWGA